MEKESERARKKCSGYGIYVHATTVNRIIEKKERKKKIFMFIYKYIYTYV